MAHARLALALLIAGMVALGGCLSTETPVARAADVMKHRCRTRTTAQEDAALLSSTLPLRTETHCNYDACSGTAQVFGVRVFVRPPSGVTADRLALALQCDNARGLLQGETSPSPADLYRLPDAWVYAEVAASSDGLVITLSSDSVADNIRIRRHVEAWLAKR